MQKMKKIALSLFLLSGFVFVADVAAADESGYGKSSGYEDDVKAGDDGSWSVNDFVWNMYEGKVKIDPKAWIWQFCKNRAYHYKERGTQFLIDHKHITAPLGIFAALRWVVPTLTKPFNRAPVIRNRRMLMSSSSYAVQAPTSRFKRLSNLAQGLSLLAVAKGLFDRSGEFKTYMEGLKKTLDGAVASINEGNQARAAFEKLQAEANQRAEQERKGLATQASTIQTSVETGLGELGRQVESQNSLWHQLNEQAIAHGIYLSQVEAANNRLAIQMQEMSAEQRRTYELLERERAAREALALENKANHERLALKMQNLEEGQAKQTMLLVGAVAQIQHVGGALRQIVDGSNSYARAIADQTADTIFARLDQRLGASGLPQPQQPAQLQYAPEYGLPRQLTQTTPARMQGGRGRGRSNSESDLQGLPLVVAGSSNRQNNQRVLTHQDPKN